MSKQEKEVTVQEHIAKLRVELENAEGFLADAREYNSRSGSWLDESRFSVSTAEDRVQKLQKALTRWERLQQAHADAVTRQEEKRLRLASAESRGPEIGDEYLVTPLESGMALTWLIAAVHPEDKGLFLAVPVDDVTCLRGMCDVEVVGDVARCGFSLWLPIAAFPTSNRVEAGLLDLARTVRKTLADMVRGQLSYTEEQEAEETNPDYQELRLTVGTVAHNVEEKWRNFLAEEVNVIE